MKRLGFVFAWVAGCVMTASVVTGCGQSSNPQGFAPGSSQDDSGGAPSPGPGADDASLPGAFGDAWAGGDSPACALHCSADLHSVLDCNNQVVSQCAADQGCASGGCVSPCDSAKANKSTFGCEYYAVDPDVIAETAGACFAAFIANTWNSPVTITGDWNGQPLALATAARVPSGSGQSLTYAPLQGGQLQPGEVAVVFLNRYGTNTGLSGEDFDCPTGIVPAVSSQDGAIHGTGIGHAFHIVTDRPVVAYDMLPFGGGRSAVTGATLLLPTSAWDTNYVAVNAFGTNNQSGAQPFFEVVAQEDGTKVTVDPTAAIVGGNGVAPTGQGQPHDYVLDKGQYLQVTQDVELTGTPILSDKPVGVWGGATCLFIDVGEMACDSAHQQLFPVKTLGHEYAAVRYRDRFPGTNESVPWRIVGAVDGTQLAYDPAPPSGAPATIDSRHVATFWTSAPFVVKSQDDKHPFYLSGHMTGGSHVAPPGLTGVREGRGDPEFVNVIPPEEYLSKYVFFTDPTYPETNLVVVRAKGQDGAFGDVQLDCAGTLRGWTPLGNAGQYEYTRVDLVTGNFQPVGACNNGRHEIESTHPFALTVWGWGSAATGGLLPSSGGFYTQWVSYAYPAGASIQPINTVVVPVLQ
jgi:hypothetical protein